MKRLRNSLIAATLLIASAHALEPRTWIVIDGRTVDGELQKVSGNLITILDKDGKQLQLDKSALSIGDNEYIKEYFPDAKAVLGGAVVAHLPEPAKLAKIDPKTFKPGGVFHMVEETWDVLETPHFKVMFQKPVEPKDTAELAERMWFDAAYVHATLPNKFNGVKMAIFLAPTDAHYDRIGKWYADIIAKLDGEQNAASAASIRSTWPPSASANMRLTSDIARANGVMEYARVFRAYRKGPSAAAKPELIRGVWEPFYVHCLADDMIEVQAGGVSEFGAKGYYALTTGHAYFKEVSLTGKCQTGLLRSQSQTGLDVSTVGGLADPRSWPSELKKLVRKGEVKATFESLTLLSREGADAKGNVLAYAWARYLQHSLPFLAAYNKLVQRISTSNQVPEPDDLAKIYGFPTAAAMEADFQKWLQSPEFH